VELYALIDGGSSDSFIQLRVAKFLNLTVQPASKFCVMVSNFETMEVEGYIPSLYVSIQGHNMHIPDVYLLHVAGGDLMLGTLWLKRLKAHIVDYIMSFICFLHEGKFITLLGDKSKLLQPAQS